MIEIHATGPSGGDATYPYRAVMDRPYTVREFVDEVAAIPTNWGRITVTDRKDCYGKLICEYRYGKMNETIDDDMAGATVLEAWGGGGWSRYDFTLLIAQAKTEA